MKPGELRTAKLNRTQIRNLQPSSHDAAATELTVRGTQLVVQSLCNLGLMGRGPL